MTPAGPDAARWVALRRSLRRCSATAGPRIAVPVRSSGVGLGSGMSRPAQPVDLGEDGQSRGHLRRGRRPNSVLASQTGASRSAGLPMGRAACNEEKRAHRCRGGRPRSPRFLPAMPSSQSRACRQHAAAASVTASGHPAATGTPLRMQDVHRQYRCLRRGRGSGGADREVVAALRDTTAWARRKPQSSARTTVTSSCRLTAQRPSTGREASVRRSPPDEEFEADLCRGRTVTGTGARWAAEVMTPI